MMIISFRAKDFVQSVLTCFFLFLSIDLASQVIWQEDWQTYSVGIMDDSEPESKGWDARLGFGSGQWKIEDDGAGNKYLSRLNKANECCYWKGCRMLREEAQAYDDVYFGFRFKFDSNFDFKNGGKLNGIIGGNDPSPGVPTDGASGASVSLMWRPHPNGTDAYMHTYTYCENKDDKWGQRDTFKDGSNQMIQIVRNKWYNLVIRLEMNTQNIADGHIQVFLDGVSVMDRSDYLFRSGSGTWGWDINQLIYFFGGNGPGWAPSVDSYVYEDDWILSQSLPVHLMNGNSMPQSPTANIGTSSTSGQIPLAVTFDGSASSDFDGTIVSYSWDFGDGSQPESGVMTSHTYTVAGSYTAVLTVTDDDGLTDTKSVIINASSSGGGGNSPCSLQNGWQYADVGSVSIAGEVCYTPAGDQYEIQASGADIWGYEDQFGYVYRPISGDDELVVELTSLQNTHSYAKAGIMIREDLSADSRHAMIVLNQTNRALQYRRAKGGNTEPTSGSWIGPSYSHPTWIRLKREDHVFSAYLSSNGSSWSLVDTVHIAMKASVFAGFVLTSHTNAALNTTTFSNLSSQGSSSTSFPVELLDFRAEQAVQGVALSWVTVSEFNNHYFSVERSVDGSLYEQVSLVPGSGTSQLVHEYSTMDENPWDGVIYYRLSQTDFDGVKTILSTIAYNNQEDFADRMFVYPNPVDHHQFTLVTLGIPEESSKRLSILDAQGKVVYQYSMTGVEARVDLPSDLSDGIYHVMIEYQDTMLGTTIVIR